MGKKEVHGLMSMDARASRPLRPLRLRRCQLSVPGTSEKMLAKAAASDADYVFCDLEDAVAPAAKPAARATICQALKELDWGATTRCVRVNDVGTPWCFEDIVSVVEGAGAQLDLVMLPKPRRAADVQFADILLTQLEQKLRLKHRIGLEVLIEEVEAMQNVAEIAGASPRLEALIFGMGDYAASQGLTPREIGRSEDYPGDFYHYPRYHMTVAARAAGLDAIDGPFVDFRDEAAYREECRRARMLGMAGKWAIHPAQIAPAQEVFAPTEKELARARSVLADYKKAQADGAGALAQNGVMVDAASVRIAEGVVARADLIAR